MHRPLDEQLGDGTAGLAQPGEVGVDSGGPSVRQDDDMQLEENLQDQRQRVQRSAYRALPGGRIFMANAEGRQGPLGTTALQDTIVERATFLVSNASLQGSLPRLPARLWTQAMTEVCTVGCANGADVIKRHGQVLIKQRLQQTGQDAIKLCFESKQRIHGAQQVAEINRIRRNDWQSHCS